MAITDTNEILRALLVLNLFPPLPYVSPLLHIVGQRMYCPRLPENTELPALGFFTRGGESDPYIPGIVTPSVQFDCWGSSPIEAETVYIALYDTLQGVQNNIVVVDGSNYTILSAIEESQGQDLVDVEIPNLFRVLAFFSIMIRATT